jgi:hypothetical protein
MPFYIRKSVSVGPFRFNLSSRGMGVSAGIKGLRIGTGPRGNYIRMGRSGLYYRASLGSRSIQPKQQPRVQPSSTTKELSEVETGDILQMVPASAEDILAQINNGLSTLSLWPYPLILGAAGAYYVSSFRDPLLYLCGIISISIFLTLWAIYVDIIRKTVVVMYDLESDVESSYNKFLESFAEAWNCQRIWNIDTSGGTNDWKRNAGATRLLTRTSARMAFGCPSVVKTNINVPCVTGGRQSIYFFPDLILVMDSRKAGAVMYRDFVADWGTTVFIEEDGVPRDSEVVGYTWRYVNKNGGPDKRFNNNRRIPKARYQTLALSSESGLQKLLHLSKVADRSTFDLTLRGVTDMVSRIPAKAEPHGQYHM